MWIILCVTESSQCHVFVQSANTPLLTLYRTQCPRRCWPVLPCGSAWQHQAGGDRWTTASTAHPPEGATAAATGAVTRHHWGQPRVPCCSAPFDTGRGMIESLFVFVSLVLWQFQFRCCCHHRTWESYFELAIWVLFSSPKCPLSILLHGDNKSLS